MKSKVKGLTKESEANKEFSQYKEDVTGQLLTKDMHFSLFTKQWIDSSYFTSAIQCDTSGVLVSLMMPINQAQLRNKEAHAFTINQASKLQLAAFALALKIQDLHSLM